MEAQLPRDPTPVPRPRPIPNPAPSAQGALGDPAGGGRGRLTNVAEVESTGIRVEILH